MNKPEMNVKKILKVDESGELADSRTFRKYNIQCKSVGQSHLGNDMDT